MPRSPLPHQKRAIAAFWALYEQGKRKICVQAPCGAGKCLGFGTPILTEDGRTVPVQDIVPGDRIAAPGGGSRTVLGICRGQSDLYRITPIKGDSFVVNSAHILVLNKFGRMPKAIPGATYFEDGTYEISAEDYFNAAKHVRWMTTMRRSSYDFPKQAPLPIDPYFMGIWLGDGNTRVLMVHKPDIEIQKACEDVAAEWGCEVRAFDKVGKCKCYSITSTEGRTNRLLDAMRELGLLSGEKFIPRQYLTASRGDRLQILAGLLDTDGHMSNSGFDFIQKIKSVSDGVVFLARSLGLAAYARECRKECTNTGVWGTYYRVSISGNCSIIPTRIPRKKSPPRRINKNPLNVGFKIEPIGVGDYYGFQVDGDGRFLLGDFTVTHNSMLSTMIIKEAVERLLGKSRNKKVHIAFLGHRRLLVSQTSRVFTEEQIDHGIQAAGMDRDEGLPIQICSRDTLTSRHLRRKHKAPIPLIDLLIIDERHVNKSGEIVELEKQMRGKNPDLCTLSLTATPVDIWNVCDDLIIAGTNSELRATVPPLHLPCKVFAPDMLDIRMLKRNKVSGEFEEAKSPWANAQYAPTIFGRVYPHWKALNPEQRPAILFAPSVASSMYFVDLFIAKGVPAAHIDGECIYTGEKNEDGSNKVNFTTDIEEREKVFSGLKSGQYKVLCNRLVLADAIDLPWAYHLILATSFGSIATYLQAVGRIQRAHSSLPGHVCLARGTQILTNKGLVEIQDVTRGHFVWDGVEFVKHDGAVCRGVKPVIQWDGLIATPDHKVHTEAGWEEIAEAARWKRRVTTAGVGGKEIPLPDHSDSQDARFWSKASSGSSVRTMQETVHDGVPQAWEKRTSRLHALQKHIRRSRAGVALQKSPEAATKMPRSNDSRLQRLRRSRNKIPVQVGTRGHLLDCCKSRHPRRQIAVHRQDRQREELRTWESALGYSCRTAIKSANAKEEREEGLLDRSSENIRRKTSGSRIRHKDAIATAKERPGRRCHSEEMGEVEVLQEETAEVWDILNCGPRHRYCANCKLVSNCVQDHGSNALRFGHPDIDREWKVGDKWDTFVREIGEENERIKDKSKPESEQKEILCECGQFRMGGPVCPNCGRQSGRNKVMVLQLDGKLKPFKPKPPKKVNTDPPAIKDWKSLVYRVKNAHSSRGMTFEMMLNAFKREHRGCIVHPNKDKHGIERWCVLHDGKVVPLPLLPPIKDSHMMSLRVGQVSPDDFKALYRLSNE